MKVALVKLVDPVNDMGTGRVVAVGDKSADVKPVRAIDRDGCFSDGYRLWRVQDGTVVDQIVKLEVPR